MLNLTSEPSPATGTVLPASKSFAPALKRNFCWTFAGNIIYSACQWGLLSLLAKLTAPEVVGEYALAVAVTAPLLYIANFNIGVMFVTDAQNQFTFGHYRAARIVLTVLTMLAAVAICFISHFSARMFLIVMITSVTQSADCISELYRSVMLRAEQMSRIAVSLIIRGMVSIGSAGFVLYETRNLVWALLAMATARLIVLVGYDIPITRGPITFSNLDWRRGHTDALRAIVCIAVMALPLTLVTVLTSVVLNIPRYFIEYYSGRRELGIFAAMWSLLTAGNMVAIALGQAIFPRLARLYSDRDLKAFKQVISHAIRIGLALGLIGVAGAILAGKQVLTIAYRPEYAQNRWMFVAVMATGILVYMITLFGNVATAARAFRQQAVLMAFVATITLGASAGLVPIFGLWGAVCAINGACLVHLGGLVVIVTRIMRRESAAYSPVLLWPERA